MAPLAASVFNQLGQYANSHDSGTHCFFPIGGSRDDQAELAWVAWLNA